MQPHLEFLIAQSDHNARLDAAMARISGQSRQAVQRAIADGAVYVDGSRQSVVAFRVRAGQTVRWMPAAPDRGHIGQGLVDIVFQDESLCIVDKPAGLPSQQPPRGGDAMEQRLALWLRDQPGQPTPGQVHRLDRDVSGLLMYGLGAEATSNLAEQLKNHTARRRYLALVRTAVPPVAQTISEPIAQQSPGVMRLCATGMPAQTRVLPLAFDARAQLALLLIELDTGRTHQIRLHCAWAIGALVGDVQYGDRKQEPQLPRVGLHAAALRLRHPFTGQDLEVQRLPGRDFWQLAGDANLPLPDNWLQVQV